jgi:hypothetical protein
MKTYIRRPNPVEAMQIISRDEPLPKGVFKTIRGLMLNLTGDQVAVKTGDWVVFDEKKTDPEVYSDDDFLRCFKEIE